MSLFEKVMSELQLEQCKRLGSVRGVEGVTSIKTLKSSRFLKYSTQRYHHLFLEPPWLPPSTKAFFSNSNSVIDIPES